MTCSLGCQICWRLGLLLRLFILYLLNFWYVGNSLANVISKLLGVNLVITGNVALGEIPFSDELVSPSKRHSSLLLGLFIASLALLNLLLLRLFIFKLSCLFNGETLGKFLQNFLSFLLVSLEFTF